MGGGGGFTGILVNHGKSAPDIPQKFSFIPDGKVLGRTRAIWERGLHVGEPDVWGVAKGALDLGVER